MSVERQLRREMLKLLRQMDMHPRKSEREQMLLDTFYYVAGLLNITIREEKVN